MMGKRIGCKREEKIQKGERKRFKKARAKEVKNSFQGAESITLKH